MRGDEREKEYKGRTDGIRKTQEAEHYRAMQVISFNNELVNSVNMSVVIFGYITLSNFC